MGPANLANFGVGISLVVFWASVGCIKSRQVRKARKTSTNAPILPDMSAILACLMITHCTAIGHPVGVPVRCYYASAASAEGHPYSSACLTTLHCWKDITLQRSSKNLYFWITLDNSVHIQVRNLFIINRVVLLNIVSGVHAQWY